VSLKRVERKKDPLEEMYHTCRWCHYFKEGKCWNRGMFAGDCGSVDVFSISEEGYLSEVLNETVHGVKLEEFRELEYKLRDWGVSEKRIKEFNSLFAECFDQWADMNLIPELDEKVSVCYQNRLYDDETFTGIEIANPEDNYCKDWC